MRIACALEYDGGAFRGWQRQAHDGATVQACVEAALSRVADETVSTVCAGRTDSGVHALGQVVHFETTAERPDRAWVMGVNSNLPASVAVRWARRVPDDFSARFSAVARRYAYFVREGVARPALWHGRAAWCRQSLDAAAMADAASHFRGEHDFSSFRSAACQARHAVRRVDDVTVRRFGPVLRIDVRGNAFLHNMVRIMAGVLMAIGRRERPAEWVAELLEARDRTRAAETAPAAGLYFAGPTYPDRFGLPAAAGPIWPGDGDAGPLC